MFDNEQCGRDCSHNPSFFSPVNGLCVGDTAQRLYQHLRDHGIIPDATPV